MRSIFLLFGVVCGLCVLMAPAGAQEAGKDLQLFLSYDAPTFSTLTLVFVNDSATPVRVVSMKYFALAAQSGGTFVRTADWQPVYPKQMIPTPPPPPTEQDLVTVPAHGSLRQQLDLAPFEFPFERGKLYILKFNYNDFGRGPAFSGMFPYGLPKEGVTLTPATGDKELLAAIRYPNGVFEEMILRLTNNSATPVKLLSLAYLPAWNQFFTLLDAAGTPVPQEIMIKYRAEEPTDYVTIPPHSSWQVTSRVTPFHQAKEGVLNFLNMNYTDVGGKRFTGVLPYGMPIWLQ